MVGLDELARRRGWMSLLVAKIINELQTCILQRLDELARRRGLMSLLVAKVNEIHLFYTGKA